MTTTQRVLANIFDTLADIGKNPFLAISICISIYLLCGIVHAQNTFTFGSRLNKADLSYIPFANASSESPTGNVSKICKAVAWAESTGCKNAVNNNCHGVMYWSKDGVRHLKSYPSTADSFKDCERIWSAYYKSLVPNVAIATRWTGNDKPTEWLHNFNVAYNR